jgi:hypothetical protein
LPEPLDPLPDAAVVVVVDPRWATGVPGEPPEQAAARRATLASATTSIPAANRGRRRSRWWVFGVVSVSML